MLPAATVVDPAKLESGAWYVPLTGLEFTLCQGTDSARFLQGQLSCNVQKLADNKSLRGALCNLKGRVITDLRVVSDNTGILLLTQYGMREKLLTTLNKYRVFFKTTLEPLDNTLQAVGLGGPQLGQVAASLGLQLPSSADDVVMFSGLRIIALPTSLISRWPRFMAVYHCADGAAQHALQLLATQADELAVMLWQLTDVRDGQVHIRPEQTERYTPQLLNYDINGVIDFKKGCYTGQEIVARMHYKAEAKRRLYYRQLSADNTPGGAAGAEIDVVDQVVLPDGSVESLVILAVDDASDCPGITELAKS